MIIHNVKINQDIKNNNGMVVGIMESPTSSATCVGKKQVSWLHLSDLHLGHDSYNESVVIGTLLEDIKDQIITNQIKLDFIFITGDLTYSGTKEQFHQLQEFINQLSIICGINKNNIILVPGNHDIFRDSIPEIAKKNRDGIRDRDEISEIIGNEAILEQYSAGLENYRTFLLENFEWSHRKGKAPLSYTVNTTVNDVSISIVALNTAWLSYGGINEKGKIIMGERQVRRALAEIDNPQITIALMHHPFEWLEQFDANDVQRMLERRSDFILNGHEHKSDIIGKGSIFGKAFKISAGSTYETRNRLNSYNIVCCNLEEKSIICYLRKFQDANGGFWIEDNSIDNSISNGRIEIRLPERLSEIVVNDVHSTTNKKAEYWVSPSDSDIQIALPLIPRELVRHIREGNCILFAGAGTSLDAGLPSWSELLRNMVEKVDDCGLLTKSQKLEMKYLLDNQDFVTIAEFCKKS